nr:hypothetical protein [Gemmatimonadota bacterium]
KQATSELVIGAFSHDIAPRGAMVAAAPAVTTEAAISHSSGREAFATLVHNAIEGRDHSIALSALLRRIERRAVDGDPRVLAEYQRLLRGWVREMSQVSR